MTRLGRQQSRGSRLPFGRVFAVARVQVVVTATCVRVDEQQAFVLAHEGVQDFEQRHVFVDVGEVAGVVLVAIFHGTQALRRPRLYTVWHGENDVEAADSVVWSSGALIAACANAADTPATPRGIAPPTRLPEPVVEQGPAGARVDIASVPRDVRRAVVADAARRFTVAKTRWCWSMPNASPGTMASWVVPSPVRCTRRCWCLDFACRRRPAPAQMLYHTDSRGTVVNCAAGHFQTGPKQLPATSPGTGDRHRRHAAHAAQDPRPLTRRIFAQVSGRRRLAD